MIDYDNAWLYCGKQFTSDDIGKAFGFIYIITEIKTKKMYIGQKMFWGKKIKQTKGVKKKIKCESDWKDYYSSSEYIKKQVLENGISGFKREILVLTSGKGQSNYTESKIQMDLRVLENPDSYLNGMINMRCSSSHLKLDTLVGIDEKNLAKLYKQTKKGF